MNHFVTNRTSNKYLIVCISKKDILILLFPLIYQLSLIQKKLYSYYGTFAINNSLPHWVFKAFSKPVELPVELPLEIPSIRIRDHRFESRWCHFHFCFVFYSRVKCTFFHSDIASTLTFVLYINSIQTQRLVNPIITQWINDP